ncbi:MAG TPA: hypothetical protein HA257_05175 [Candidatus Methanoperedenaceae archaeon]|nr:hypothetical protein [Candidatus Methanoperedenaceae archaeon]
MKNIALLSIFLLAVFVSGCTGNGGDKPAVDRESKIPQGAVKLTPEADEYPPILHSDRYEAPVPVETNEIRLEPYNHEDKMKDLYYTNGFLITHPFNNCASAQ